MCFSALFALLLMLIHVDSGWNLNTVEYGKHFEYKEKVGRFLFCMALQSCGWQSQIGHRLVVGSSDIGESFVLPASVCAWPRQS